MLDLIGRAHAQIDLPQINFVDTNENLTTVITTILTWILFFAGTLAVIYLVYGGILYITAGGDAEKATKGRTAVVNAIIGIVIIILALVIVTWINRIFQGVTN